MDTMKNFKTVKFREWNCRISFDRYLNNRIAIQLYDLEDGSPVATATVNIPDLDFLNKDEVIIKDYSENEGMLEALINADIISKPLYYVLTSFVKCPVCKLLITPENYENEND